MKLLHEEYIGFDQLLDEMPSSDALSVGDSYFGERDEDCFGDVHTGSSPDTESTFNIVSRYAARKGL